MRDATSEKCVSFVRGHGAGYSSDPAGIKPGIHQRAATTLALDGARKRAAEQLAFQRAATREAKDQSIEK